MGETNPPSMGDLAFYSAGEANARCRELERFCHMLLARVQTLERAAGITPTEETTEYLRAQGLPYKDWK